MVQQTLNKIKKWVEQKYPQFAVYSDLGTDKKYLYYISKVENNNFSLRLITFMNAKELPLPSPIHHTLEDAKKCAEEHYAKYSH